jgi:hypothetical protein
MDVSAVHIDIIVDAAASEATYAAELAAAARNHK